MNKKPRISIITVSFNSEKTIGDTIESVIKQGMKDYEHIIVDGGSKDGTADVVKKYEDKYEGRLRFSSEPDKGIYDAMNKGLRLAQGDLIGILNSDDFYASNNVLQEVSDAYNSGFRFIYGNLSIVKNNDVDQVLRQWNPGCGNYLNGWIPPHPTLFVSKEIYSDIGLYNLEYKISADYDFMIRCLKRIPKSSMYNVDSTFTKMRVGGVSNDGIKSIIDGIKQIHKILIVNKVPFALKVNMFRLLRKLTQYTKI